MLDGRTVRVCGGADLRERQVVRKGMERARPVKVCSTRSRGRKKRRPEPFVAGRRHRWIEVVLLIEFPGCLGKYSGRETTAFVNC